MGLVAQLAGAGHAVGVARRLAEQMGRLDPHTLSAAKRLAKPIPKARLAEEKDRFCELLTRPVVRAALRRFVTSEDAMPYLPRRPPAAAQARS